MSLIKDPIEDFKAFIENGKVLFIWAAKSAWKRLFTVSVLGAGLVCVLIWYSNSLNDQIEKENQEAARQLNLLTESNAYHVVMDWANLCISSREKKDPNTAWYCARALELYKSHTESRFMPGREEIIANKAYGAMMAEMSSRIRGIEITKITQAPVTEAKKAMQLLLSTKGLLLTLALIVLLPMSIFFGMHLYKRRMPEPSQA